MTDLEKIQALLKQLDDVKALLVELEGVASDELTQRHADAFQRGLSHGRQMAYQLATSQVDIVTTSFRKFYLNEEVSND